MAIERPGLALRLVEKREVLSLCQDERLDLRVQAVQTAFARGDICVASFEGDYIVGYCWLAFAPIPHLDRVWVQFGREVAWTYKSLVRPSHRGRGIAPALYRFADDLCRERGRSHSVICVESHNRPSVSAALRANYHPAGYGGYVLRGMPLLTWCTLAARRHGVAFFLPPAAAQG